MEVLFSSVDDVLVPSHATAGAAGIDMRAVQGGVIEPGQTAVVGTSIAMAIPEGYFGLMCSRSGLAAKYSVFVANTAGVVDSDYRGEVRVLLHNAGSDAFTYEDGDRISQLVILKHECASFTRVFYPLPTTVRGAGGFGSTGV